MRRDATPAPTRSWRICAACPISTASPARIALRSARPRELAALRDALPALGVLAHSSLSRFDDAAGCRSSVDALEVPPDLHALLARTLHAEPAANSVATATSSPRPRRRARRAARHCATTPGSSSSHLEARERARTGIANLRVEYNRVHGFYIEVTHGQAGQGARRLPAAPDAEERRALHHAGTQGVRGQGAVGAASARWRREKAAVRAAARRARAVRAGPAARRGGARRGRRARRARAPRRARPLDRSPSSSTRPGSSSVGARHAVVERELEVYVPNDCVLRRRAPPAGDHRPEHGRQVDLHALGRADRAARLCRQLRAGDARAARADRPDRSRASARPTTWRAAARPSWSR